MPLSTDIDRCQPHEAESRRTYALVRLPTQLIDRLEMLRTSNTHVPIMIQLGVSANTWRKIRSGHAVRWSVAERLRRRAEVSLVKYD